MTLACLAAALATFAVAACKQPAMVTPPSIHAPR